jgi:iron complex outermembrane recepter protein
MQFAQTQIPGEPLVSLLDTQNNPVDLRLRPAASWKFAGFRALLAANFTDRYWDTASVPERRISAWTTVDLQLSYEPLATDNPWLRGLRLQLNAQNVFNVDPPFLNNQIVGIGYDQENANPYGRVVRVQVAKGW